jgi:hypothetical protein
VSRREWQTAWSGHERDEAQVVLLECARAARREATVADALALYKAAHAVLPLRGAPLIELALLLVEHVPVPLEWCDVLMSAKAGGDALLAATLREALEGALRAAPEDDLRAAWARRWLGQAVSGQ